MRRRRNPHVPGEDASVSSTPGKRMMTLMTFASWFGGSAFDVRMSDGERGAALGQFTYTMPSHARLFTIRLK